MKDNVRIETLDEFQKSRYELENRKLTKNRRKSKCKFFDVDSGMFIHFLQEVEKRKNRKRSIFNIFRKYKPAFINKK